MKMTKNLRVEILKVYHTIWDAYLRGDMRTFASLLDEDCHIVGSAAGEIFNNKRSAVKYYTATAQQVTGKVEFRNRKLNLMTVDKGAMVNEQSDFYLLIDDQWTFYGHCRITSLLHKKNNTWKVIHQHGSFPDAKTGEGEQVNPDKIKQENIRLRDAVKRRTIELEEKNRELEIETALEKVRAIALGMKKAADMLDVCKTISLQLQSLGLKEIRNVQTAIFYPSRGTYMNYEYYAKHKKTFITDTVYTDHKIAKAFAAKMLKGKGQVSISYIKGEKKVKEWLAYQKKTNVFIDRFLEKASSLTYYWHSLGPVALGISTYVPLKKEELNLFERFLNVFELAYTRYLDIEKAQVQAREALIEAALERVRVVAMGMHRPDDILNICKIIYKELTVLGFADIRNALINFWDDSDRSLTDYDYSDFSGGNIARLSYSSHPVFEQFQKEIRRSKDAIAKLVVKKDQLASWRKRRRASGEYEDPRLSKIEALYYYFYSIGVGSIGISSFKPLTDDNLELLKRFRNVFDLSYSRYLDIQKAEEQAREARIEAALERTRTQSMIMQHSKELDDTLRVFHEQVTLLGIQSAFSFLWLPDEVKDRHIFWAVWREKGQPAKNDSNVFKSKSINYAMDRKEPATAQCLIDWKSNEPVYSYNVPPAAVKNYFAVWQELIAGVEHLKPKYFSGGLYYVEAFMKYGCFGVMVSNDLTEEEKKLLNRFAVEFERTYTRFLGLQKAE